MQTMTTPIGKRALAALWALALLAPACRSTQDLAKDDAGAADGSVVFTDASAVEDGLATDAVSTDTATTGDGMGASTGMEIVATIYSRTYADGSFDCKTAGDPDAAKAGYWDLGSYGGCDASGPMCGGGSHKVLTAAVGLADGGTKYHTACVLVGQPTATRVVATIHSEEVAGVTTCATAADPVAAEAGYWDSGSYAACSASGLPRCDGNGRPVLTSAVRLEDGRIKYHTACVLTGQPTGSRVAATIYSAVPADGAAVCKTASDADAAAAGYFDVGGHASCDADGTPRCTDGAEKVLTSAVRLADGTVKYQTACVVPDLGQAPRGTRIVATIFSVESPPTGECRAADDPQAAAAGYWDTGQFGRCDGNIPRCAAGSRKLLTAATRSGTRVKYHTTCVLP